VAQVKGVVLTDRDRTILAFVGVARYASAEQVHRLVFDSPNRKLTYRRLAKLCEPGGRPGEDAYLRRLEYRKPGGAAVHVWTLTPYGRAISERCVPYLQPAAEHDVGHQFLEHTLLLNEVLLGLVLALRASATAPLKELPFRWLSENDDVLQFEMLHRHTGAATQAVLKPDAILEVPRQRRRLFLEAETGAHSIATANPARHGAVLMKLQRYARFFSALAGEGKATYYARSFPDGLFPVLVFLVHSDDRKRRVDRAVKEWLGAQPASSFRVRVITFAEASAVLAPFVRDGSSAAPQGTPRVVAIDDAKARQLREGYTALAETLNATRRAIAEHNGRGTCRVALPPAPIDVLRTLRDVIRHDLLGEPRPVRGSSNGGAQ
jgi:hypothetical protein